jgi:hypothetical protein
MRLFFLENIPSSTIEVFVFELYSLYTDIFQNYAKYEAEQLKQALDAIQVVRIIYMKNKFHFSKENITS